MMSDYCDWIVLSSYYTVGAGDGCWCGSGNTYGDGFGIGYGLFLNDGDGFGAGLCSAAKNGKLLEAFCVAGLVYHE
jgi:hypothetical protein